LITPFVTLLFAPSAAAVTYKAGKAALKRSTRCQFMKYLPKGFSEPRWSLSPSTWSRIADRTSVDLK
jgi:hypothetical protein